MNFREIANAVGNDFFTIYPIFEDFDKYFSA